MIARILYTKVAMRKLVNTIMLLLCIVLCTLNASAQDLYEVSSEVGLNVRSKPSTNSQILGRLQNKAQIEVIKIVDNWAEFTYGNQLAYVSSKYILKIDKPHEAKLTIYKVVNASSLNVRNKPTTQSAIVGSLKQNELIDVISITGNWAQIKYNESNAYVSLKYIEKVEQDSIDDGTSNISANEKPQTEDGYAIKEEDISLCNAGALEKIGVSFVPNGYLGYANFVSSDVSPKGGFGWGVDFAFEVIAKEKVGIIPKNYYGDISFGYTMRGSYAVPMHYINIKIRPLGYRLHLPKFNFYGKLGIYTGFPLSNVSTNNNMFTSKTDCGLSLAIGAEYDKYGVGLLYEQGFVNVCSSSLSLKNTIVCINFTYKLFSSK